MDETREDLGWGNDDGLLMSGRNYKSGNRPIDFLYHRTLQSVHPFLSLLANSLTESSFDPPSIVEGTRILNTMLRRLIILACAALASAQTYKASFTECVSLLRVCLLRSRRIFSDS